MALRLEELAKTIDHTLLDPAATVAAVDRLCEEARLHHFASVCVWPTYVSRAADLLRGADVKVCAVVGFPFGADVGRAKVAAAEECVSAGADELDVVANVPAMASGDFRLVQAEIGAVLRAVRMRSVNSGKGIVLVKVVVEAALLDDKRKRLVCKVVEAAGADFVQTSSGWGDGAVPAHEVEFLRDCLSDAVGVKAAGAVSTLEEAADLVNAGAARIGTSQAVTIMRGTRKVRQPSS